MTKQNLTEVFTTDVLQKLFPKDRADHFFEAMYGDAGEGAYDITLKFKERIRHSLLFEFHLSQREGKCLACNLTYGLPAVFSRHPIIDIQGLVEAIQALLPDKALLTSWTVGNTREVTRGLHVVPLVIQMAS